MRMLEYSRELFLMTIMIFFIVSCATPPTVLESAGISITVSKLIDGNAERAARVVGMMVAFQTTLNTIDVNTTANPLDQLISLIDWGRLDADETILVTAIVEVARERMRRIGKKDVSALRAVLVTIEGTARRYVK